MQTSQRRLQALALIASLTLAPIPASAGPASAPAGATAPPKGINCVWMPTLKSQSYTVIDARHLVIEAAGHKFYLLTLYDRCTALETTLELGLARHGSQLCAPGDSIISGNQRCPIQYLEQVASEPAAEALVDARAAAEKAKRKSSGH